jgi:hypothetical protein
VERTRRWSLRIPTPRNRAPHLTSPRRSFRPSPRNGTQVRASCRRDVSKHARTAVRPGRAHCLGVHYHLDLPARYSYPPLRCKAMDSLLPSVSHAGRRLRLRSWLCMTSLHRRCVLAHLGRRFSSSSTHLSSSRASIGSSLPGVATGPSSQSVTWRILPSGELLRNPSGLLAWPWSRYQLA